VEHLGILGHVRDRAAQARLRAERYVLAVDQDLPVVELHKPERQAGYRRFPPISYPLILEIYEL
jgi:hypothetical protein